LLISTGSVASMTGNNVGGLLTGSRMLFALAENGELPRLFGKIHPRYHTPSNAIGFTTVVIMGLALSGSFTVLAVTSAVARLVIYTSACAATLRLRHPRFQGVVKPATFVIPAGGLVPLLAIAVSLLILGARHASNSSGRRGARGRCGAIRGERQVRWRPRGGNGCAPSLPG
jgi:amino acid transporter